MIEIYGKTSLMSQKSYSKSYYKSNGENITCFRTSIQRQQCSKSMSSSHLLDGNVEIFIQYHKGNEISRNYKHRKLCRNIYISPSIQINYFLSARPK